jgi:hypothetical protein
MKKIIISGILVTALALVAFNFYNNSSKEALSDVAKANIEALADDPNGNGDDMDDVMQDTPGEGNSGGGGTTWLTAVKGTDASSMYAEQRTKGTNSTCLNKRIKNTTSDGLCSFRW